MAESRKLAPETVSKQIRQGLTPRYVEWVLANCRKRNCSLEDFVGPPWATPVRSLAAHWGISKKTAFSTLRDQGEL